MSISGTNAPQRPKKKEPSASAAPTSPQGQASRPTADRPPAPPQPKPPGATKEGTEPSASAAPTSPQGQASRPTADRPSAPPQPKPPSARSGTQVQNSDVQPDTTASKPSPSVDLDTAGLDLVKLSGEEFRVKYGRLANGYGATTDRLSLEEADALGRYLVANGFVPKAQDPVMDEIYTPHGVEGRFIKVARIGPENVIQQEKDAMQNLQDQTTVQGVSSGGLAGRGTASDHLVPSMGGAAVGEPGTYDQRVGAYKSTPEPYAGMVPPTPGQLAGMKGFQNELEVARITDGRLARQPISSNSVGAEPKPVNDGEIRFTRPNGQQGVARPDVYGKNGELIYVGGPAKGEKLSQTIQRLTDLKDAAASQNVKAQAYFTSDTPNDVITKADSVLGRENVRTFDRPAYKQPRQ
jgi:hypothetical protein